MNPRGRPAVKPSIPLVIWVLVELMRDRSEAGRERASARQGCKLLEKHLAECFQGGHRLGFEAIRRHYKKFETVMRRSNSGSQSDCAKGFLEYARQRRNVLGWKANTWTLVIDPDWLPLMGYQKFDIRSV